MIGANLTSQELTALNEEIIEAGGQKRFSEALDLSNEIVRRYGHATDPEVRTQVVRAFRNAGICLGQMGRGEEAVALLKELISRYSKDEYPQVRVRVAESLCNRGALLLKLGRHLEALEAFEEVEQRYAQDDAPSIQNFVANARQSKGSIVTPEIEARALAKRCEMYQVLKMPTEVSEVCDEILVKFGKERASDMQDLVASVLLAKGNALSDLEQYEDAMAAWTELAFRFARSSDADIRERVAIGLFNKGLYFSASNQLKAAVAAYQELYTRFKDDSEEGIQIQVAMALVNEAQALDGLELYDESEAANDEVVRLFGHFDVVRFQVQVAMALVNKATDFGKRKQHEQALSVYHEVVQRFNTSHVPELEEKVNTAMWNTGLTLRFLQRTEAALAADDNFVARFGPVEDDFAQLRCAQVLVNKAIALQFLGQYEKALVASEEALRRCSHFDHPAFHEQEVKAWLVMSTNFTALGEGEKAAQIRELVLERYGAPRNSPVRGLVARLLEDEAGRLLKAQLKQDALALLIKIVQTFVDAVQEENIRDVVLFAMHESGALLAEAGLFRDAIPLFEDVLEICSQRDDEYARWTAGEAERNIGICLEQLRLAGLSYEPPAPSLASLPSTATAASTATPNRVSVGNVAQLLQAIETANAGDIILLQAGQYELNDLLLIDKSLCLGGEGAQKTRIVFNSPPVGIAFLGDNLWMVQDLEFVQKSEKPADVLRVHGGTFKMRRCTISGVGHGYGLWLDGAKTAFVQQCHITGNQVGAHVGGEVEAVLENNRVEKNKRIGIVYEGNARGVARGNECCDHHYAGIGVGDRATPRLENNFCYRANFGIVFRDEAQGQAIKNRCTTNYAGIGVTGRAQPELEENRCENNHHYGIVYNEQAAGSASDNECTGNNAGYRNEDNLKVHPHAKPLLDDNWTEGESDEENPLYTQEFSTRLLVQTTMYMSVQSDMDLDSLVPGRKNTGTLPWKKTSIHDDELSLASIFEDFDGSLDDDFVKRVLPRWIEIYKRIVAEGRWYG